MNWDKDNIKSYIDLTILKPDTTYTQVYRLCNKVRSEGYRSACVPSKFLETCKKRNPKLLLSTAVNYPYGLHGSDVVLREIQGVVGVCTDISHLEIEVVAPRDLHYNYDLFAEWNYLATLKLIIQPNDVKTLDAIPKSRYKIAECITLIRPQTTTEASDVQLFRAFKQIQDLGYKAKIAGSLHTYTIQDWLEKVDIIGTSNLNLLG